MEIAVVGTDDFVTGFQLSGVRTVFVIEKDVDEKIMEAINSPEVGVIVMEEEELAKASFRTKKLLEKLVKPVLITLSSKGKETDLRQLIKRTVGVDLWKS
ncbi:MAG: V-type ATP synthase subunit F [archaeon]|nr:V-type ATP synthase subunit F [Candidatus Micrarchaeota archaeon]